LSDPYGISTIAAEAAANTLICLINQGSFLWVGSCKNWNNSFCLKAASQNAFIANAGPYGSAIG
jgi:hypothetical protein